MIPHIENNENVTFFCNGQSYQLSNQSPFYDELIKELQSDTPNIEGIISYCNNPVLKSYLPKGLEINLDMESVFYNGEEVNNSAIDYLFKAKQEGKNISSIESFIKRLFKNPNMDTINNLFDFVSLNSMPICDDGCFLAYKVVNENMTSIHDFRTQHKVGENILPILSWDQVDTDRKSTCSYGYHFCSWKYIEEAFRGIQGIINAKQVLLVLKIDPEMVAAIPYDYDGSKGRARTYLVESIYSIPKKENYEEDKDFLKNQDSMNYIEQIEGETKPLRFYNKRDSKGRFVKMQ